MIDLDGAAAQAALATVRSGLRILTPAGQAVQRPGGPSATRAGGDSPDADRFCAEDRATRPPAVPDGALRDVRRPYSPEPGVSRRRRTCTTDRDRHQLVQVRRTELSAGYSRLESSPLFYVHPGACDRTHREYLERFYRPDDGWVNTWDDIRDVIKQLVHNTSHPLESDPALASGEVVYHPPARVVDLRPPDFAITPKWFVGNPDLPA